MKIINLFTTLFLWSAFSVNAQAVKPVFKRLVYITYHVKKQGNHAKVIIEDYADINSEGRVHLRVKYYTGTSDTAFRLSNETIQNLNAIYTGKKKLTSYKEVDKLRDGMSYGGSPQFVFYIDNQGRTDELNFIPVIMQPEFNAAFNDIVNPSDKINKNVKSIHDPVIEQKILNSYKNASFLSNLEDAPQVKIEQ